MRSLRISWFISEIPPHARRRDPHSRIIHIAGGNTSACAEKSISCPLPPPLSRKYLRMRGEESPDKRCHAPYREIPPHARRRGLRCSNWVPSLGNTSACAEKSSRVGGTSRHARKYLRMRGEEMAQGAIPIVGWEIPPHARRRGGRKLYPLVAPGNTSACAEKRPGSLPVLPYQWKYLRMRGEEGHPGRRGARP